MTDTGAVAEDRAKSSEEQIDELGQLLGTMSLSEDQTLKILTRVRLIKQTSHFEGYHQSTMDDILDHH